MISPQWLQMMAKYNAWQNENLYRAADTLEDAVRKADKGIFWNSIHATFCHILWSDQQWMSRIAGTEPPSTQVLAESGSIIDDWEDLKTVRASVDRKIRAWSAQAQEADYTGELRWYSGAMGQEMVREKGMCVCQLFNHQTHHRGQIHAVLTQEGAKPGATDLPFMPEDWSPSRL